MRTFGVAVVAAVLLIVAEVAVFVAAVKLVGLAWALLALVATCALGGWLVGREGIRGWRRFRAAVAEGRPPGREATDGLVGLIAALLLVAPGFITDVAGALLLVPPVRWLARDRVERIALSRTSPALHGSLFGPRLVRARRGRAGGPPPSPPPPSAAPPPGRPDAPPAALEGEIIEP
jgi:UPF0716 protein FxsA